MRKKQFNLLISTLHQLQVNSLSGKKKMNFNKVLSIFRSFICKCWVYFIVQTLVEEEDGIVKPHSQADTSQVGSSVRLGLQFKGIVRPFDLEGETRLIRSTVINFEGPAAMIQSHERNIKPVGLTDSWDGFVQSNWLTGIFQTPEGKFYNSYQFRLTTSRNCSSLEDGFRLLVVSSFEIPACRKPGIGQSR
jgi:hypothetical protein